MDFKTIRLDVANGIATLTLDQPESHNGLTLKMQTEMHAALDDLDGREDVHVLILTGAGKSFCSGADLSQLGTDKDSATPVGDSVASMMERSSNPLILKLQNMRMPVVAAVNGAAAGAGISIALAADIVIAARSAFFLTPFLPKLGIVPDLGSTWFLPQNMGRARALGMMLLGDRLTAEKALEWGLIWGCVDDAALMAEAERVATQLAQVPAHAALEARRALNASANQDLAAQLKYETQRQRELLSMPSFREGVLAFFEKRTPDFRRLFKK